MSIYITGDTHSDFRRFRPYIFNEQLGFSGNPEDNYMIICGDFGGIWYSKDYEETREYLPEENDRLVKLNSYPWTTLFVDGNHDNFDRLYSYPVEDWHGGKVHKIKPNIIHLMRGESYLIEDKRFFCFGGASSHDISDGIIDPVEDPDWIQTARDMTLDGRGMFRVKHISWWSQELPSQEEMNHGIETLDLIDWKCDFVVTHCAPSSVQAIFGHGFYKNDYLNKHLEEIHQKLDYTKWFFGHMHHDRNVTSKDICLYEQIVQIN